MDTLANRLGEHVLFFVLGKSNNADALLVSPRPPLPGERALVGTDDPDAPVRIVGPNEAAVIEPCGTVIADFHLLPDTRSGFILVELDAYLRATSKQQPTTAPS